MGFRGMIRTFAMGAAAGAAAVYLTDPEKGQQRRQQLVQKADQKAGQLGVDLGQTTQDLKSTAQGLASDAGQVVKDKAAPALDAAKEKVGGLTGSGEEEPSDSTSGGSSWSGTGGSTGLGGTGLASTGGSPLGADPGRPGTTGAPTDRLATPLDPPAGVVDVTGEDRLEIPGR
jgi:gas vesicle protein